MMSYATIQCVNGYECESECEDEFKSLEKKNKKFKIFTIISFALTIILMALLIWTISSRDKIVTSIVQGPNGYSQIMTVTNKSKGICEVYEVKNHAVTKLRTIKLK